MLRRLVGLVVLAFCVLVGMTILAAILPALPFYAFPVAGLLWLTIIRRRSGPSSIGSERQTTPDVS